MFSWHDVEGANCSPWGVTWICLEAFVWMRSDFWVGLKDYPERETWHGFILLGLSCWDIFCNKLVGLLRSEGLGDQGLGMKRNELKWWWLCVTYKPSISQRYWKATVLASWQKGPTLEWMKPSELSFCNMGLFFLGQKLATRGACINNNSVSGLMKNINGSGEGFCDEMIAFLMWLIKIRSFLLWHLDLWHGINSQNERGINPPPQIALLHCE